MVIDRFEDGASSGHQLQVLFHDLDVVAVRVQRGERQGLAFVTVVVVVVVNTDRYGPVSERFHETIGEGGLAGPRYRRRSRAAPAASAAWKLSFQSSGTPRKPGAYRQGSVRGGARPRKGGGSSAVLPGCPAHRCASFLPLAQVGDRSGGQFPSLGGLWRALPGVGLVAVGVVAQAEAVADEEQHQAVFCCCLAPAGGEVQRRVEEQRLNVWPGKGECSGWVQVERPAGRRAAISRSSTLTPGSSTVKT